MQICHINMYTGRNTTLSNFSGEVVCGIHRVLGTGLRDHALWASGTDDPSSRKPRASEVTCPKGPRKVDYKEFPTGPLLLYRYLKYGPLLCKWLVPVL